MAYQRIDAPQLSINNEVIPIKPNTLKYTAGQGEDKVEMVSAGGGSVVPVHGRDVSTLKSKVVFEMPSTTQSLQWVRDWKANRGANAISISDRFSGAKVSMSDMSMVNDPEAAFSADGSLTCNFEGAPAL